MAQPLMPPIPRHLLIRALCLDVLLTVLMLTLSLQSSERLWQVIWGGGALVSVLDAMLASSLIDLRDRD
jgi:hypothetical protein